MYLSVISFVQFYCFPVINTTMIELTHLQENFPFLSGIRYLDEEYVGIIQNSDDKIVSFYNYNAIKTEEEQKEFLRLGDMWWWESNRLLPINIFLKGQMESYRPYLRTVVNKDVEILFGPVTSLNNIMKKRIKRRQIQLIRKDV